MRPRCAARPIQVHEVDPIRPAVQEIAGGFTRVLVKHCFAREVPLDQVHALAVSYVNGRINVHVSGEFRHRRLAGQANEVGV